MKVLALVTDAFGGYGGISQYNRDFLTASILSNHVNSIDVLPRLAPDTSINVPDGIFQQRPIHNRIGYSLQSLLSAVKRPDVIFCGHVYHGPLAWRLANLFGAKLVSQLHGDEVWTPLSPVHLNPLKASDLVLCVSRNTRDRYIAQGVDRDNAAVLPNTVAPDYRPGDRFTAKSSFGLKEEVAILTVARLDARAGYKGHDRIIPLMRRLREAAGRDTVYLIAGQGEDKERLEALAAKCGVASSVRFLGNVPRTQLPDLYRAADVFALPSMGEGFGIAFLEAMGCGTPAIGLDVGGAPDALDGMGMCVSEEDFPAALVELLMAPAPDAHALSEKVHEKFGFEAFKAHVAEVYGRLCEATERSVVA